MDNIRKIDRIITVLIGACIGLFLVFLPSGISVPLVFVSAVLLLSTLFIFFKEPPPESRILVKLFVSGFLLRLLICVLLAGMSYLKKGHIFFLGADDYGYSINGADIANVWRQTGYLPLPNSLWWMPQAGDLSFYYWISYLYYFIGEFHFLPLFINCSLGSLSMILVYLIAKNIYSEKVAIASAGFFIFWPSLLLWSTQNLKESVTVFIILLVFLCVIKLRKSLKAPGYWATLFISLVILLKVRVSVAGILGFSALVSLCFFSGRKRLLYSLLFIFAVYACVSGGWLGLGRVPLQHLALKLKSVSLLATFNQYHAAKVYLAESAFLPNVNISTFSEFIYYSPVFLAYILFSPFPWDVSKLNQLPAVLEMLLWILLLVFAARGLLLTLRYKLKESSVILLFLFLVLLFSFGEGNVGTLFRHRALIWPCWFILISAGFLPWLPQKAAA